ncbi:MAG: glucosaminidase domain-containing protein [Gammaproteobacteria bacterium]|jgi:Bax protein
MSVNTDQGSASISYGALATSLAIMLFIVMLASSADRWITRFPPLPDFTTYKQVDEMKVAFFDYLSPIVEHHNKKILNERQRLDKIQAVIQSGKTPSHSETRWLRRLANNYNVEWKGADMAAVTQDLLVKVDIVPVNLAVIQAAKESSWGRSRYAVRINNLFGQWCYKKGCGMVPQQRSDDARHEVRRYESISEATRSYMHNLNSHRKYSKLRAMRQELREQGQQIDANKLVDGLFFYSERRQQYVDEIRSMIRQYGFYHDQQLGRTKTAQKV